MTDDEVLEKGDIFVSGDIDREQLDKLIKNLYRVRDLPTVRVHITSSGGSVYSALGMYDTLKAFPGAVLTRAYGAVESAAVLVLQAGDKRQIAPHCTLMVHQINYSFPDYEPQAYIETECREIDRMRRVFVDILPDSVAYMFRGPNNYWLSAEHALELGLVDEIC